MLKPYEHSTDWHFLANRFHTDSSIRCHLRCVAEGRRLTSRRQASSQILRVCAEGRRSLSNPFGQGNREKEAEARKALEGLFKGKKDSLAANDVGSGSGGGGAKGSNRKYTGGGGDSSSGGQGPDWREWSSNQWKRLGRTLRALTAITGFIGVILVIPLVPQLFGAILTLLRLVLRLDGRARSLPKRPTVDPIAIAGTDNLGLHEMSIIRKYGNDGS